MIKSKATGKSQNLIALRRGNDKSGAPSINGNSQLPNAPTRVGITLKKIIIKAWDVTTEL